MMDSCGYNEQDRHFMSMALAEARQASDVGDYPVGAVLTFNGIFLDKTGNSLFTDKRWTAHAEHSLISRNSGYLLKVFKSGKPYHVCLYTTLEPCLMCLGIAMIHRVSRIVVACPDPHGGTLGIDPESLGIFYREAWPQIQTGLFREEACELVLAFLKTGKFVSWEKMLAVFEEMRRNWE
jgi:tRNA(adenine34) deaminase